MGASYQFLKNLLLILSGFWQIFLAIDQSIAGQNFRLTYA
jgi:hypothetical protein